VVAQLLAAGQRVRALSRRPGAAELPAGVEVVGGDLTVPESLDAPLEGVGAVFLLWTSPAATLPAGGDYVLTGPDALSQAEQVSVIGSAIGRHVQFDELSPQEFRRETADAWPRPVVDMLLAAWDATIGRPAYVTSTVADILGSPARTLRQWAIDRAEAFRARP
jgi:uncharacterized protein YbjT (DUF2867 family)